MNVVKRLFIEPVINSIRDGKPFEMIWDHEVREWRT